MPYRIAIDTGGTFTDLVLMDEEDGQVTLHKVCSTPENPARAIRQGILEICRTAGLSPAEVGSIIHGTTVATNAVLERKGARTALLTTRGFRDVLHIMRQDRPKLYDLAARRPLPLVSRRLRLEVDERILFDGSVARLLNEEQVLSFVPFLLAEGVQSLAIGFLHSYINPRHERRAQELLEGSLPGIEFTLSSDILPEIKEYERFGTAVMNAYVKPILKNYLRRIVDDLRASGLQSTFYVMKSNGGVTTAPAAAETSVQTLLSGPAGGVLTGLALASRMGKSNLITVDMGGTSFDVSLIAGGSAGFAREVEMGGHAVKIPMLDIHTIGAGGGSIAWMDAGGALRVGPQSAGAEPGPAAYGRGGLEPTVTDANLVLGRLNPQYFLGGNMPLDTDAARKAIEQRVARPLGLETLQAAEGIIRVINASMVKGIRHVSVQRGHDPREFTLVAFGGAGPLHAVELAEDLNIPEIIIPPAPGLGSAFGLLEADMRQDYVQTFLGELRPEAFTRMRETFRQMERQGMDFLGPGEARFLPSLDLRYLGQGYELEIPFADSFETIAAAFHQAHQQQYGFQRPEISIEIVNLRLAAVRGVKKYSAIELPAGPPSPSAALKGSRRVYLAGQYLECAIYDRARLQPGHRWSGPAIIEQPDTTTLLFPGHQARVDGFGNIIIRIR